MYVTDFDKNTHEYRLYLLSGDDQEGYDTQTLDLFPASYRNGLWLLHNLQPSYQFVPYDTGIAWSDLMAAEDHEDKNLSSGNYYPEWVKEDSPVYDAPDWMTAKTEVVAYFLDPRNFLDPVSIFQFEKLSFDPSIHTVEGIKSMVRGSFLEAREPDYASILLAAGQESGASPYFLASRIIQEMGRDGISELSSGTLPGYEGYFNFYNIGSTPDPDIENGALINGAKFAMWGRDPLLEELLDEEKALLLPWTSADLAIRGGALWIASSYIDIGQNTLYFQKFDVVANDDGLYYHQYAQNVSMAYSESIRYHRAYLSQDMLRSTFSFVIPVYLTMPEDYGYLPPK
jgi:beta-N-acetylglucosaminidase